MGRPSGRPGVYAGRQAAYLCQDGRLHSGRLPRRRATAQGHAAALVGTAAAGFGTAPAMVAGMRGALFAAGPAHLGTQCAEGRSQFAAARHGTGSCVTGLGAIHVQRNAAGHHADIIFMQAGRGAFIAGRGAVAAGIDAGKVGVRSHGVLPEGASRGGWWFGAAMTHRGKDRAVVGGRAPQRPFLAAVPPGRTKALPRPARHRARASGLLLPTVPPARTWSRESNMQDPADDHTDP